MTDLDYSSRFAERMRAIPSWTTFTEDPDLISLAGGLPDTSLFGSDLYADLLSEVARTNTPLALQYGPTRGLSATKRCVVDVMSAEGMDVDPQEMIITTGGQQAIDLLCRAFLDPGDVVIAEAPTFPGALLPFIAHQAEVVQVGMDDEGMLVDELERTLAQLAATGKRPKFIYCVPTFQNPSGQTLSLPRRRRLLELAREYDLPVIEDNPYGLLRYEGEDLPTLKSLDSDGRVLYVGTFSKILGPGLRVGWLVAPPAVLDMVDLGKQCADLCPPSTSQLTLAAYFGRGQWRGYVDAQVEVYRQRRDVMLECLAEQMPAGTTWTTPQGGLFIWVTMPDGYDTGTLFDLALRRSVMIVAGRVAFADPKPAHRELRLNFSAMPEDRIREGMLRLGSAVDEYSAARAQ